MNLETALELGISPDEWQDEDPAYSILGTGRVSLQVPGTVLGIQGGFIVPVSGSTARYITLPEDFTDEQRSTIVAIMKQLDLI